MNGFDTWLSSFTTDDPERQLVAGAMEFFEEVFAEHGAVSQDVLEQLWKVRELELAQAAIDLVVADLRSTTKSAAAVAVWQDARYGLVLGYGTSSQSPAMLSMRAPEAVVEIADNLQDHVMEDVWTTWPNCPIHDQCLEPDVVGGEPCWVCATDDHVVAAIGGLSSK